MTTVLNPLAYKDIGPTGYYWFLLGTRNRIHYGTFLVEMQKAAIREDPGSIREEKREGETAQKPFPSKHRNPGRSGKLPGRETGREKPTLKKPAVREDPGSFREGFREEMRALQVPFPLRFHPFLRHQIPPIWTMRQFHGQKWPHGKLPCWPYSVGTRVCSRPISGT